MLPSLLQSKQDRSGLKRRSLVNIPFSLKWHQSTQKHRSQLSFGWKEKAVIPSSWEATKKNTQIIKVGSLFHSHTCGNKIFLPIETPFCFPNSSQWLFQSSTGWTSIKHFVNSPYLCYRLSSDWGIQDITYCAFFFLFSTNILSPMYVKLPAF